MKVLIVGGTSSVAQYLRPLVSKYAEVLTAGRKYCDIALDLTGDIREDEFSSYIDVVIHTAASFGGESPELIIETMDVNVLGTLKVCQLAQKKKASLVVLISSIFVCLDPASPFYSVYVLSKKHSEEIAQWYCNSHNLPLLIIRPSQIYGTDETIRRHQPIFYLIVDKAAANEDIFLYGSNDPKRNYIHIEDVVTAIDRAIRHKLEGVFACVSPKTTTYGQIAKAALRAFDSNKNVIFLPEKPDILDNACEIDTALYEQLQWYPSITLEEGMIKIAASLHGLKSRGLQP